MLNQKERKRFNELRNRQYRKESLTPEEEAEVAAYTQKIQDEEATRLAPARARMQAEIRALQETNQQLMKVVEQRQRLIERMEAFLAEFKTEREAVDDELARILSSEAAQLATVAD